MQGDKNPLPFATTLLGNALTTLGTSCLVNRRKVIGIMFELRQNLTTATATKQLHLQRAERRVKLYAFCMRFLSRERCSRELCSRTEIAVRTIAGRPLFCSSPPSLAHVANLY